MIKNITSSMGSKLKQDAVRTLSSLSLRTLISHRGEDPWVIFWQGYYYYCRDYDDRMIIVNKAARLEDIGKKGNIVWEDPLGTSDAEVWAPELHRINGKWYIYFTTGTADNHRMYVLEGLTDDPQGEYAMKSKINEPSDLWAIDGTVFKRGGKWYFMWSGWETEADQTQNLYVAAMSNPWALANERICISKPEYDWEKVGHPVQPFINEGPQALEHNGKLFIIYSASHSLTDDYCLGQLELTGNDPLDPNAWAKKPEPVFSKTGTIFGPGHASFIEKPDKTDWIVYHATSKSQAGWDARMLRAQQFTWNPDGSPNFGKPRNFKALKLPEFLKPLKNLQK